jgi:acyl carrier protein
MEEFVEPCARRLIADHLGVSVDELRADVCLREDLATDSLDLVELAMVLEAEFAIVVPERLLDTVRTYGDLVQATGLLVQARRTAEAQAGEPPPRIRVRLVGAGGESSGTVDHAGWLTPYTAQLIDEDALRAGRGARLDVAVSSTAAATLDRVRGRFAALRHQGIEVTVRRDDRLASPTLPPPARRVVERHPIARVAVNAASPLR